MIIKLMCTQLHVSQCVAQQVGSSFRTSGEILTDLQLPPSIIVKHDNVTYINKAEIVTNLLHFLRETHDVGSVGCLKNIKQAISVARSVMEHTLETLLVGDDGEPHTLSHWWTIVSQKSRVKFLRIAIIIIELLTRSHVNKKSLIKQGGY